VVGSRGSVVLIFLQQKASSKLTITDERMTRFWLTLEQGVRFVIHCVEKMHGGEVFIPKIPSMKIIDLAIAIAPQANLEVVGIRPGEKLHEVLISEDESRSAVEMEDMYIVQPNPNAWFGHDWQSEGQMLPAGFRFGSDNNPHWLSVSQIREMVAPFEGHPVNSYAEE
jgi:UDP-N-acetylglucosamine 4,6-dehydratase